MDRDLGPVVERISDAEYIVALTGAGMSVESGIAPFRGEGGLWKKYDPNKYAHIRAFRNDPERCWELFKLQIEEIFDAEPHEGHYALSTLEEHGLHSVITQNIDGLHQQAGNSDVIEVHGSLYRLKCTDCREKKESSNFLDEIREGGIPHCDCGGMYRPDVVMFGESLPSGALDKAWRDCERCDLMLVIGTSAVVQPAASFPIRAKNHGADIIELNLETTPLTDNISDHFIPGEVGTTLPRLIDDLTKHN